MMEIGHSEDLAELFHENTKNFPYFRKNKMAQYINLQPWVLQLMSTKPKDFQNCKKIALHPAQEPKIALSLEEAILRRESWRKYSDRPLSLSKLTKLLYLANGIQKTFSYQGYSLYKRNVPSSGNLGSIEIYPFVLNVEGLQAGVYYYNQLSQELACLKTGDFRNILKESLYQPEFTEAAVLLALVAAISRVKLKYGERGYRYVYLDAGHIGQNIYLVSTGLDLGCCGTCGFIDDEINELLGINGADESVVYMLAIGEKGHYQEASGLYQVE
jgi:SagB-type dehydrogenase family enzyme